MCLVVVLLVACSGGARRGGGYYLDDGPDANPPANLDAVPDAVPKIEPFSPSNSKPYVVFGKTYTPDVTGGPYKVQGRASWYGKKFHGNSTANGERYNMYGMTAAHPTLPLPSYARVTRISNGKSVVVRVNDRGPFLNDRVIDLSYVAAYKLGVLSPGSAEVLVERIMPEQIANGTALASNAPPARPISSATTTPTSLPPPPLPPTTPATQSNAPAGPAVATLPLAAAAPASTTPAAAGSVYLQLGAFSDPARAQAIAARAAAQVPNQAGVSVNVELGAGNLHRVRVGPFASTEAATQAAAPLESALGVAPRITGP
jgi:rare lipoprotein A